MAAPLLYLLSDKITSITHMKIEVSRSFSKKVQVKQYEPVEFFCAAKVEVDVHEATSAKEAIEDMQRNANILDQFCQDEVAKSHREFMAREHRQVDRANSAEKGRDAAMTEIGNEG